MRENGLSRRDGLHVSSTLAPLRIGSAEIRARLEQLYELLQNDSARTNTVFRQILEPITITLVEEKGERFYRAAGAEKGAELLDRLRLAQAVDFGGCGGLQPPKSTRLTFEVDVV